MGRCHMIYHQCPKVYVHITDTASNNAGWAPTMVKNNIISGGPATKDELHQDIRPCWSYKDDLAVIDGVVMRGRCIIVPEVLKQLALHHLHVNHTGIEKTKLLVSEPKYWVNINNDLENYIKNALHVLSSSKHRLGKKTCIMTSL